jgi:glycosidase
VLEFYKKILRLRHTNRALVDGSYMPLKESDQNVFSYLRSDKGEVVLVALNMSASPQKVNFDLE